MFKTGQNLPLWQQWVLVSGVAGSLVASLPLQLAGAEIADGIAFAAVWIGQWLLMRRMIPKASRWLLVSLIGGFLAVGVGIIPADRVQDTIDGIKSSPLGLAGTGAGRSALGYFLGAVIAGAGFGTGLGLAQWLILRWQFLRADWWIPANAVGFAVGMALQGLPPLLLLGVRINILLLVPGIATGLTLKWLLARPVPKGPATSKRPLGVLLLAVAAFLFAALLLAIGVISLFFKPTGAGAPPTLESVLFAVSVVVGIPLAAAGIGLLKGRKWARVIIILVMANNLLGLAIKYQSASASFALCWTAFHILMLWYLCRPRVVWFFGGGTAAEVHG